MEVTCLPKAKICFTPSAVGEPHLTSLHVCLETLNVLQTVQILLGGRASNVLMTLATFTYDQLHEYFTRHDWSFNRIVSAVTDILTPYEQICVKIFLPLISVIQCCFKH